MEDMNFEFTKTSNERVEGLVIIVTLKTKREDKNGSTTTKTI